MWKHVGAGEKEGKGSRKKKSEKRGKREKLKWEYVRNERFSDELFKASNPATPLEAFLLKGGGEDPAFGCEHGESRVHLGGMIANGSLWTTGGDTY